MTTTGQLARERRRGPEPHAAVREARRSRGANVPAPAAAPSLDDFSLATPGAVTLRRMATLVPRYAPHDGVFRFGSRAPTRCGVDE